VIRHSLDGLQQDSRYALRWCARDRRFACICHGDDRVVSAGTTNVDPFVALRRE